MFYLPFNIMLPSLGQSALGMLISLGCFNVLLENLGEVCNFIPIYQNSYFLQNKMS